MKKKNWQLVLSHENFGETVLDMVAHCEAEGKLISTGVIFRNGQFIGTANVTSNNFFKISKKPKKANKSIAYSMAHYLAVTHFTGGKKGLADSMVVDCFNLNDERSVRFARTKYEFPSFAVNQFKDGVILHVVGDSLNKSGVVVIGDPDRLTITDKFDYSGPGIAWGGGYDKAIIGDLNLSGDIRNGRGKITI